MTTIISIGRNTLPDQTPMSVNAWGDFIFHLNLYFKKIYFGGEGYKIDGGKTEENYTVVGELETSVDIDKECVWLCERYKQEYIAITQGETRFVTK